MTDDLTTAFSHPSERAKATASGAPRDRISMTEHLREIEIGAFQAERGVRQTVRFDVVVEVETRAEQAADDVDRILSYDTIVEAIDAALEAERVNLLETLASRIADGILAHPLAARVFVRIGKLDRGPYTLGVEIVREAPPGRRRMRLLADQAPHPAVVFLSNERSRATISRRFSTRLQAEGAPLILCVDRPEARRCRAPRMPCRSGASTFWRSSRGPGASPRATRAAWWWRRGPSSTGRCAMGKSASGRPPNWCSTRCMGPRGMSRTRWRWPIGWPGPSRRARCWKSARRARRWTPAPRASSRANGSPRGPCRMEAGWSAAHERPGLCDETRHLLGGRGAVVRASCRSITVPSRSPIPRAPQTLFALPGAGRGSRRPNASRVGRTRGSSRRRTFPKTCLHRLTAPRMPLAGLSMDAPRLMGILNVTPDSFSDGGAHAGPDAAVARAREMVEEGPT
jgi:dihydroneopterin aldolase